jgi:hydroxyacylglutathione hydrolase
MLEIVSWQLGSLQTNSYLVWDKNKQAVIIDPADDPEFIADKISSLNVTPLYILATHGHFDHILAVTGLKLIFNIPFLCSQADEFLIKSMTKRAGYWQADKNTPIPVIDKYINGNEEIVFGEGKLTVVATPGHTPGGVCFYNKNENILFTGDTLFNQAIGRSDLSYSSPDDLKISVQKLLQLPPNIIVYPGHGLITTIAQESKPLF